MILKTATTRRGSLFMSAFNWPKRCYVTLVVAGGQNHG
jgi:hypothetical protein